MIGKTISHYKVVDKLGEGGMGAVYKAEDTTLNRLVAIKTLSQHLSENEEARERFVREAQAASAINHPNITTVFELLEEDDSHYIAMEYVDGKTIRDMVESGHVSIRKAVDIILQAAEALSAAHRKGILHRDVKSANIMVSMEGNVKVMDFGLAHLEERSQLTRSGTTMGTLAYSSPEQLTGRPYDERSEIWSLGVVFYELLTGQLPFKSPSEGELLFAIINNEQDSPNTCREDAPESVCGVINKMLLKQPELRYQNCGELINDLKAIRSELETTSVQISSVYGTGQIRAWKHTVFMVSASTVVVASLLVLWFFVLAPTSEGPPRLAVLSFEQRGTSIDEYFAESLADEIQNKLATISGLDVIQFYGSRQYVIEGKSPGQIGEELGVDFLLDCTIQLESIPTGQVRVRLIPSLTRVSDGKVLPLQTSEATLGGAGLIQLQTKLAIQVARALDVVLLGSEQSTLDSIPTENQEAYLLFLRGIDYLNRGLGDPDVILAAGLLEQAVAQDPSFAMAYAILSKARSRMYFQELVPREEGKRQAYSAVQEALRQSPDLPQTKEALGWYFYWVENDYLNALASFSEAQRLLPRNGDILLGIGLSARRLGQWTVALSTLQEAAKLDPLSSEKAIEAGISHLFLGEYEKALERFLRAVSLSPDHYRSHIYLALASLAVSNKIDNALDILREGARMTGEPEFLQQVFSGGHIPGGSRWLMLLAFPNYPSSLSSASFGPKAAEYLVAIAEEHAQRGETELQRIYGDSALAVLEGLQNNPERFPHRIMSLALANAGRSEEAIQEALFAVAATPISRDARSGPGMVETLARVYLLVGEYESAVEQLEKYCSVPTEVGLLMLRHNPIWDPLRDNTRFQALLEKYR
ncbi:protein kinase [Gemmatimonadota bacterium]